jgi:CRP-like cAMP-binding protein
MISVVSNLAQGQSVEIGVVGREGMSGIEVLMGVDSIPNESMVQLADGALRMTTAVIRAEFKRGGALQDLLMRYTHTLLTQVSQSAVCNRLHSVVERLARWLLMCQDRAESDDLPLTQEFIAMMLGTRRSGVTEAAIALQGEGYIRYSRGHITILDRPGLEEFTCECYAVIKAESNIIKP